MTHTVSLPLALDEVADQWRNFISNIPISTTFDMSKHVDGSASIYEIQFVFNKGDSPKVVYYAGMTKNPTARLAQHKSELKCCKATTRVGKSKLYCEEYFGDLSGIQINFAVRESGFLNEHDAKHAERALSDRLQAEYGPEAVLTRPRKKI